MSSLAPFVRGEAPLVGRAGVVPWRALFLVASLCGGCGKSTHSSPQTTEPSVVGAQGGAGTDSQVSGTAPAGGVTSASNPPETGAAAGAPSGVSGSTAPPGAVTLSEAQWTEQRPLQYVPHSIREAGTCGDGPRADPGAPVQPTTLCSWVTIPTERYCDIEPYCLSDADCTDGINGRCQGYVDSPKCDYGVDTLEHRHSPTQRHHLRVVEHA